MTLHACFYIVLCCLLHLLLCQHLDAERISSSPPQQHHRHHRRAVSPFLAADKSSETTPDEQQQRRFLPFVFLAEPDNTFVRQGSAELHCAVSTSPVEAEIRFEWRKDGTTVSGVRTAGRVLITSNGSLLIEQASTADEGFYQCVVHVSRRSPFPGEDKSVLTFVSRRAQLRVPSPKIEQEPAAKSVRIGESTAFQCWIDPSLAGAIEWYKDDRRIYTDSAAEGKTTPNGYVVLPVSKTLQISSATREHAGKYKCVIRDGPKVVQSREVDLTIESSPMQPEKRVAFIIEPRKTQAVTVNDQVILECLVTGKPKIRWLRDGVPVTESHVKPVGVHASSLLIDHAKVSDSGQYTCRADDGKGGFIDASATVIVRVPPRLMARPKNVATQETADVEFECRTAPSIPPTTITWYKNGEVIVPSDYFAIEDDRLRVLGLVRDDHGAYQCVADNEVGSVQASAQLVVDPAATHAALTASAGASTGPTEPPTAPLGIKVVSATSRVLTLRWDAPLQPRGDILAYHVHFREEDSTRERTLTARTTTATIGDLKPNAIYVVRIVAENRVGPGPSSVEFKATTLPEESVPSRVRNLKATVVASDSIQVSWDAPATNSEGLQYKLFYARKNRQSIEEEIQVHMTKTGYILHDLESDAEYVIRVEAVNANGPGPSSEAVTVRTFTDVPSKPPEDVRFDAPKGGSIRVSWKPPPTEERNGEIVGYKIKFKTRRRGSKASIVVVDGDPGEYTLNGLEPATQYTFRIAASNQNGTGPFTNWMEFETIQDDLEDKLIAAPRGLQLQATRDSIICTWEAPLVEGIIVRSYEIGWGMGVPDQEKTTVDAHTRSHTIRNLKPSREYVVAVRGVNNAGPGFPIYETIRTLAYSPASTLFGSGSGRGGSGGQQHTGNMHLPTDTPMGVRAEAESSSAIRLSWTDPERVFDPYYTVKYWSSGDNYGNIRFVNTSENEVLITDLRPNMAYEFAVKLMDSPYWSMTVSNRTQSAPPSSAPRDLTVVPPRSGDHHNGPNYVTLNWQPPKYANGDISDYSVLYTYRPEQHDHEWLVDSVPGDKLSMIIGKLIPHTTYYFKIQARNSKGIGPFSSVVRFEPSTKGFGRIVPVTDNGRNLVDAIYRLWESNKIYVVIGCVSVVVVLGVILCTVLCLQRGRGGSRGGRSKGGYVAGRKRSAGSQGAPRGGQPDYWIANGGQVARPVIDLDGTVMHDLARLHDPQAVDSPPPRYQSVPGNGTISRSYHHSSTSLEGRQRTPQIVYSASNRQPIAKIDFATNDHASSYGGSSTGLAMPHTPPPQSSAHTDSGGYRTVRMGNPLKSFAQGMMPVPPPVPPPPMSPAGIETRTAHIVRPIVVAAPNSSRGSPLTGSKPFGSNRPPPVGRAIAQPRINVANDSAYSPYSSTRDLADTSADQHSDDSMTASKQRLHQAASNEELAMVEIEGMMRQLQELQNELAP